MRLLALGGRARFRGLASLRARLPVVTSCLLRVPACARALGTTPHTPAPGAEISPRLITSHLTSADSLSAILEVYKCHGNSFDAINVATAWNRLGKARATDSERAGFFRQEERTLMQLLQHTERFIPRLDARGIAGASYGMARLGFGPAGATMRLLGAEAIPRIGEFKPQELANTAWTFAKLGVPAPELFKAIASTSEQRIAFFKPQELSNTAWAFATLGVHAPELFEAITHASLQRIGGFNAQDFSNTAWAFAKLGVSAPLLFEAISRGTVERVDSFTELNLENTAWAFAKFGIHAPELVHAIARESEQRLDEEIPTDVPRKAPTRAAQKPLGI